MCVCITTKGSQLVIDQLVHTYSHKEEKKQQIETTREKKPIRQSISISTRIEKDNCMWQEIWHRKILQQIEEEEKNIQHSLPWQSFLVKFQKNLNRKLAIRF